MAVLDIGVKTIDRYSRFIKGAGTVFMSGPPGAFEYEEFGLGTEMLLKAMAGSFGTTIVSGGHLSAALHRFGIHDSIDHVSTAGGALVQYLAGKRLPLMDALERASAKWGEMIRVGINGYGTIGRRVADAVGLQEDMELVGVTKVKPDYRATIAVEKGIPVYVAEQEDAAAFEKAKVPYAGNLGDLLNQVDVILDATPELGAEYKPLYEKDGRKAVFQGGEEHELTGFSFVAQCNYDSAAREELYARGQLQHHRPLQGASRPRRRIRGRKGEGGPSQEGGRPRRDRQGPHRRHRP